MALRFVFIFCCLLMAASARAGDVFVVDKVQVDTRARSAAEARRIGLRQAQEDALRLILRRLTREADWPRLPDTAEMQTETLVQDLRVTQEKRSGTRYLASLSVSFKPDLIRMILQRAAIPMVVTQANPILLLPLFEDREALQIWEDNLWRDYWQKADLANNTVPIILPLGDEEDQAVIWAEGVLLGNPAIQDALRQRYGIARIIIAHAIADVENAFNVRVNDYGADDGDAIILSYEVSAELGVPQAAKDVLQALSAAWKAESAVIGGEHGGILLRARYRNLDDHQDILRRLRAANLVRAVTVHDLTVRGSFLNLSHAGTLPQLENNLRAQGLVLTQQEDYWDVAREQ